MNQIKIRETDELLEIEMVQKRKDKFPIVIFGLVIILCLFLQIYLFYYILFVGDIDGGVLLFLGLTFFITDYLMIRSFLWRWIGREFIQIKGDRIYQKIDYGWFKDNVLISKNGVSIQVYDEDNNPLNIKFDEEILDEELYLYEQQGFIRLKKNGDVVMDFVTKIHQPFEIYLK